MKKGVIACIIVLSCFLLVGCRSHLNKEKFGKLYYSVGDKKIQTVTKSGTLDPGNKWESVQFSLDKVRVSIMKVEDRTMEGVIHYNASLKKKKIQKIDYYYEDKAVLGNLRECDYYVPVGKDMYTITFIYQESDDSKKVIDSFMKTIEIEK